MRRALGVCAVALALVAPASAAAPARLLVGAQEYRLSLSRTSIKSGAAIIQLANYGDDAHDLALRRVGGTRVYVIGEVEPGGVGELQAKLLPGTFKLWCTLADHAARGMTAKLVVRK